MKIMNTPSISERFAEIREVTMRLIQPLEKEDFVLQSHPDVSPAKWHIAHTTWFFERMILKEYKSGYQEFNSNFDFLFNSYYNTIGPYQPRHERGVLSRPIVDEIIAYRNYVNEQVLEMLSDSRGSEEQKKIEALVDMGLQHEQQHQELILMDVKYNFFVNPLFPRYSQTERDVIAAEPLNSQFVAFEGGLVEIGHSGEEFSFDNERPRHKVWLEPFKLASQPVTNKEYMKFIEDGGYEKPEYWLSDGWNTVKKEGWKAPLYWMKNQDGNWKIFTLDGIKNLEENEPVCHVSFYEADAFSRWSGKRLPTEAEWEHAAQEIEIQGNTMEQEVYHPVPFNGNSQEKLSKMFGDVWEWTASAYTLYPKSKPLEGALGEYNAKFMSNQMVLRGGSCATPVSHIRETYRNFFPPDKRWQFSGFRLAEDQE